MKCLLDYLFHSISNSVNAISCLLDEQPYGMSMQDLSVVGKKQGLLDVIQAQAEPVSCCAVLTSQLLLHSSQGIKGGIPLLWEY